LVLIRQLWAVQPVTVSKQLESVLARVGELSVLPLVPLLCLQLVLP